MPIHEEDVHEYDQTHFRLEEPALHLVSLLLADKELGRLYGKGKLQHLAAYAEEEKKSTIMRLTIEIATAYRLMYWNANKKPTPNSVGRLCEDDSTNAWEDLTMLEACHKVIHAEYFAFESRRFPRTYANFLKPRLHLAGMKGRKKWLAIVEVLPFADAAIEPIDPLF